MNVKGIFLSWITVKDMKSALEFYTKVMGLKLDSFEEKYGWAELSGPEGGCILGVAKENECDNLPSGHNAVVTISVADIEEARNELIQKQAKILGEVIEIPGHVKLFTVIDPDGNRMQVVQKLN